MTVGKTANFYRILETLFIPCFVHTLLRPADSDRNVKADNTVEFARCFLRLANLPNFALDRLSRYEATLWRQAGRVLIALDALGSAQTP